MLVRPLMSSRLGLTAAVVLLASAGAVAQVPRGFKRFENKLAGVRFCYPLGWKELPREPTEEVVRARYVRPRPPRELKFLKKGYKDYPPKVFAFLWDTTKRPTTRLGTKRKKKGGFSITDYVRERNPLWRAEAV